MEKKYIVNLSAEERSELEHIVKKLKGSSQRVHRAQILLKADINGPNWTDLQISEAFGCRTKTVENVRQRLVLEGFTQTLNGKQRAKPPREKVLTGEQEAQLIAMRLGPTPVGFGNWTLRLLRDRMIELEIVDSISHETVRQTLKKMV